MTYYSRALLKSTKSNFTLVQNLEKVTDERIVEYLKTKLLVKRWIEEVIEAPLSSDPNEELEVSLKNGIALCTLLNIIQPNIVPKIFTKFDFGFKNNIDFIIMALNELGFPRQKLFSLKDLYDGENFVRVVECLSELSKYVCNNKNFHIPIKDISTIKDSEIKRPTEDEITLLRIQLSQIKSFSEGDGLKSSINKINNYYQSNSYSSASTVSTNTTNSTPVSISVSSKSEAISTSTTSTTETISSATTTLPKNNNSSTYISTSKTPNNNKLERVVSTATLNKYQRPKSITVPAVKIKQHERGFILFQALFRGYKTRQFVKKMKRDIAYREKVQQEILKTEEDYIKNLNLCITFYMVPLYEKEYITKEQQKMIFSNIEIIYNFGKTLLEELRNRCGAKWTAYQKLSDLFLQISAFLKVYSSYVQNYDISIEVIKELRKSEKFEKALEEISDLPEINNFDIDSFLILPVQRIPRYYLLLTDLVKHTWPEHPDQKPLAEAAEKIKSVANFLNERKRQMENIQKFTEIQANLVGKGIPELLTPSRQYIKQINYNLIESKSEMVIYICNDCIIFGKPVKSLFSGDSKKKKNIQYKGIIDYNEIELRDDEKNSNCLNLFQPTEVLPEKQLKLSIVLKNENEKNALKKELQQLINIILENKNSIKLKLQSNTTAAATTASPSSSSNSPNLLHSSGNNINNTNSSSIQQNNIINGGSPSLINSNGSPASSPRTEDQNSLIISGNITPNGTIKPKLQRKKRIDNLLESPEPENIDHEQLPQQQPSSPTSNGNNRRERSKSTISKIAGHLTLRRKKKEKHLSLDDPNSLLPQDISAAGSDSPSNNENDSNSTSPSLSSPLSLSVPNSPPLNSVHYNNNNLSASTPTPTSTTTNSNSNSNNNNNNNSNLSSSTSNSTTNDKLTSSTSSIASNFNDLDLSDLGEKPILTYREILQNRHLLNAKNLESYLSDPDFKNIFELDREEFYKLPKWKQENKKKLAKLY